MKYKNPIVWENFAISTGFISINSNFKISTKVRMIHLLEQTNKSNTNINSSHITTLENYEWGTIPEILILWIWALTPCLVNLQQKCLPKLEYFPTTIFSERFVFWNNITINIQAAASCCFIFLKKNYFWCSLFRHFVKRIIQKLSQWILCAVAPNYHLRANRESEQASLTLKRRYYWVH